MCRGRLIDALSTVGYRPRGAGGARVSTTDDIVRAVRGKLRSTPGRPSQLDAPIPGAAPGGYLFVHLPYAGPQGAADVAAAWARLAPDVGNTSATAVEFYLPGQAPIRYVRSSATAFQRLP